MFMKVLYGFCDAEHAYYPSYRIVGRDDDNVRCIKELAEIMREENPSIKEVWIMDQRPRLAWDFREAIKESSISSLVIFKTMVEKEGLRVL